MSFDYSVDALHRTIRWCEEAAPPNNGMQATAGGAVVLTSRVGRSPAAPDAER